MAGSRIVAVRKAVTAGLVTALAAETKVKVTYGWQGSDETRYREQVFTNGGKATHDPAALKAGRNFRNEAMTFDVVILVLGVGMKPEESDQRAIDIALIVEEYLADRKSNQLSITGLNWIVAAEFTLSPTRITANASVAEVTLSVKYDARLT